jgi:cellulose biosynthesis protein BcsQ
LKEHGESKLRQLLFGVLEELAASYRYALVDCPPGQTVLAEVAIERADLVLCPTTPDWLSYWGLTSLDKYLQELFENKRRKSSICTHKVQNQTHKDRSSK